MIFELCRRLCEAAMYLWPNKNKYEEEIRTEAAREPAVPQGEGWAWFYDQVPYAVPPQQKTPPPRDPVGEWPKPA